MLPCTDCGPYYQISRTELEITSKCGFTNLSKPSVSLSTYSDVNVYVIIEKK
jgi:hypothetical protein